MVPIPFDNTYARLPPRFYSRLAPQPVAAPSPIQVNGELATRLGIDLDFLESEAGTELLAGNRVVEGADPIATAYAGHQFGHFNPRLGDGRALLLGEVLGSDGARYDLQWKGSGRTPYSRGGDGRSPLGPVLREYIVSEAMTALGIPSTRSLAAVATGEPVFRERPLPGGVLLRVARSHIRVGTFEYFASQRDDEGLELLVEHAMSRHYPELLETGAPALSFLQGVAERQAELVARWQLVGFIHGVMNTDNMLISGETIDYGPCAFMDTYDPKTVFSSIDHHGRYAYQNQPGIARWNLACLARALLPVCGGDETETVAAAQAVIDGFPDRFASSFQVGLRRKLGLSTHQAGDEELCEDLLRGFEAAQLDFTLGFRQLTILANPDPDPEETQHVEQHIGPLPDGLTGWLARWRQRLERDPRPATQRAADMRNHNPFFIPRNHGVEAAIRAAEDDGDFQPFRILVDTVTSPRHFRADRADLARPPEAHEEVKQTFCGT